MAMRPPTANSRPVAMPPDGRATLPSARRWRRLALLLGRFDKRWLVFIPAFFVILLAAMYASIACTWRPGADHPRQEGPRDPRSRRQGDLYGRRRARLEPHRAAIRDLADLVNATVATEDANFWNNPGVNIKGLARAAYENVAFWNGGFVKAPAAPRSLSSSRRTSISRRTSA